jgi:hypothetical protein
MGDPNIKAIDFTLKFGNFGLNFMVEFIVFVGLTVIV